MHEPLEIIELPGPEKESVAYLEHSLGDTLIDDDQDAVQHYRAVFRALVSVAEPASELERRLKLALDAIE